MDISQIILGFIGLAIAFASLFKDSSEGEKSTWEKRFKWNNILAVLYILGFMLTMFFSTIEYQEQQIIDTKTVETHENVDSLLKELPKQIKSVEKVVKRLSELQMLVEEVECNTIDAISERENSIKEFKKISKELKRQSEIEIKEFIENKPILVCTSSKVKWAKKNSDAKKLSFELKNIGGRTAYDLFIKSCVVLLDSTFSPIDYHYSLITEKKDLYPFSKGNFSLTLSMGHVNNGDLKNKFYYAFFIFNSTFNDKYQDGIQEFNETFFWDKSKKGKYQFLIHDDFSVYPIVKKYLIENDIELEL